MFLRAFLTCLAAVSRVFSHLKARFVDVLRASEVVDDLQFLEVIGCDRQNSVGEVIHNLRANG